MTFLWIIRASVHGRPQFAKLSVHEGLQDQIAPVHSDFSCGRGRCPWWVWLVGSLQLSRTRSAADALGLANHGPTCFAITAWSPAQSVVCSPVLPLWSI